MKCEYCGHEAAPGQKFCMRCGTRLEPKQEPERIVPAPEVPAKEPERIVPEPEVAAKEPEQNTDKWLKDLNTWEQALAPAALEIGSVAPVAPVLQLPVKRGLGKMFFLGLLTLGIYPTVIWSRIVTELNLAASRYDGRRTMPYFAMCMLAPITLGIYPLVWIHNFCGRIGEELSRRDIDYKFGAGTFWLWGVLGSLIIVGPFVFTHKLMKSMNRINADFNVRG